MSSELEQLFTVVHSCSRHCPSVLHVTTVNVVHSCSQLFTVVHSCSQLFAVVQDSGERAGFVTKRKLQGTNPVIGISSGLISVKLSTTEIDFVPGPFRYY